MIKEMMDCYSHDAVTRSHRLTFTRLNVCSFAGASSWEHPCDEKARRKLRRARRRQFSPRKKAKRQGGQRAGESVDATARADTETTAADSTPSLSQTDITPIASHSSSSSSSSSSTSRRSLSWERRAAAQRASAAEVAVVAERRKREAGSEGDGNGEEDDEDYNFDDDDLKVQMVYLEDYLTEDGEEGDLGDDKGDNDNKRRQRAEKKSTTTKGLSTAENDEPPSNQKGSPVLRSLLPTSATTPPPVPPSPPPRALSRAYDIAGSSFDGCHDASTSGEGSAERVAKDNEGSREANDGVGDGESEGDGIFGSNVRGDEGDDEQEDEEGNRRRSSCR